MAECLVACVGGCLENAGMESRWTGRCRLAGYMYRHAYMIQRCRMDGWIGEWSRGGRWMDGCKMDMMHGCRINSRTKKMSDAEHSVLDSLPLVSPLNVHV